MNTQSISITATETDRIEDALDDVLSAINDNLRRGAAKPDRPMRSLREITQALVESLESWTPAQRAAADLLDAPSAAGEALRQGVITLGRRLYELGGLTLMQDVCDRVSARDPASADRRFGIMVKRWEGIGHSDTSTGWLP
jgi:hypothetical protein